MSIVHLLLSTIIILHAISVSNGPALLEAQKQVDLERRKAVAAEAGVADRPGSGMEIDEDSASPSLAHSSVLTTSLPGLTCLPQSAALLKSLSPSFHPSCSFISRCHFPTFSKAELLAVRRETAVELTVSSARASCQ